MSKLKLPQKETKLFDILYSNVGQLVAKETIIEHVWQNDSEYASDWALNALVYRLRKNIEKYNTDYFIENEKNGGYILYKGKRTPEAAIASETTMSPREKRLNYKLAVKKLHAVFEGENHMILKMATINCILKEIFPHYFWTGFYLVHKDELVVGPYQGTFGCLRIAFGRGVCGAAAKTKKTQIVPDVNKFPGHISCDCRSQSEIVVPVFNNKKELIAVFDVDSTEKGSFDEIDKKYLEEILNQHFATGELEK